MEVLPVDITAIVAIVLGMLVVLIPIAGLTARFALKPITEAIARVREAESGSREVRMLQQQVHLLEQQVQDMERTVTRVVEEREFDRQLEKPHT